MREDLAHSNPRRPTFGIGTAANNDLGSATTLVPANDGTITTVFGGRAYGSSTIDSGSNGIFFLGSSSSGVSACSHSTDFYCHATAVDFSAALQGNDGVSVPAPFSVANADRLLAGDSIAFDDLAGPNAPAGGFLWGASFFYGRTVFTAIDGRITSAGPGPYWAY